jgi:5-methylcytosine-specific restriction endonuclease McrA
MNKKTLDNKWSKAVLERDNYTCQRCLKGVCTFEPVSPHHVFYRRYLSTRWVIDNGITLCTTHHRWAHDKPKEFKEWWISQVGEEKAEELRLKGLEIKGGEICSQ